jgi:hypothetical protein
MKEALMNTTQRDSEMENRRQGYGTLTHEVRLTFDELALIYKALEAVRTLRALPPQEELLDDTIQVVDQGLNGFVQ